MTLLILDIAILGFEVMMNTMGLRKKATKKH